MHYDIDIDCFFIFYLILGQFNTISPLVKAEIDVCVYECDFTNQHCMQWTLVRIPSHNLKQDVQNYLLFLYVITWLLEGIHLACTGEMDGPRGQNVCLEDLNLGLRYGISLFTN